MADKTKGRKEVVTSDNFEPVTISNKVTIAMLQALSKQQRKKPEKYIDDLIEYHYRYL